MTQAADEGYDSEFDILLEEYSNPDDNNDPIKTDSSNKESSNNGHSNKEGTMELVIAHAEHFLSIRSLLFNHVLLRQNQYSIGDCISLP